MHEIDVPDGETPVAWVLITTEPIRTNKDLLAVIEAYRTRWLIEELFRALKQGCALERRPLHSYETLTAALGMLLPIAWHLLLLRNFARTEPHESAERVLTRTQIAVLRAFVPKTPRSPTTEQALRAVAELGGHHLRRPPGWLVLGRGLERLLDLEAGWQAALDERSDQT